MFVKSLPKYIVSASLDNASENSLEFHEKLSQIQESVENELELYRYLKDLKIENNKIKRMPKRIT